MYILRTIGYEKVYLPLCEVADTPFQIQGDDMSMLMLNRHISIFVTYIDGWIRFSECIFLLHGVKHL